jgi:predicted RNA-binding Zn-ribbon protein involved in translation (DUF1610 family)
MDDSSLSDWNAMSTWICPYCRTALKVSDEFAGMVKPCPQCGKESIVQRNPANAEIHPKSPAQLEIDAIRGEYAKEILTAKGIGGWLVVVALLVSSVVNATGATGDFESFLVCAVTAFVVYGVAWLIIDWMNNTRQCRRLLEEVLKRL